MSTIKHQCPSCDGNLIVDSDKQLYRCISCGSTYDFDYFREEKLHDMGETHLSRDEFAAAVDTYNLILENEPHDFLALRGLMLAAANLNDVDELTRVGEAKHFAYNSKIVSKVLANAAEEDKEYFNEFGKIYADKKNLIRRNREIEELNRKRERTEAASRFDGDARYDYYFKGKYGALIHPVEMFISVWGAALFCIFLAVCFVAVFGRDDFAGSVLFVSIVAGISLLIAALFNFGKVLPQLKELKEVEDEIKELDAEAKLLGDRVLVLAAEARSLANDLRRSIDNFIKKDSLIEKDSIKKEPIKKPVSEISTIKKHQCPSCGGRLKIDSDKQMYHCSFCGSTYDYEYFREKRIHEAGETYLARGEFMATADAYEFMLKKDPHDFFALRGLMLAASRLTDMSELDREDEEGKFSYDSQMARQAIENALDEDKEYFKEFANVYSEKKKLAEYTEELEALRDKKDKITSYIMQNNIKRNDYYLGPKSGPKAPPKASFIILSIVSVFWFFLALIFDVGLIGAVIAGEEYYVVLLVLGIIHTSSFLAVLGYNFIVIAPKMIKLRKLDKDNAALFVESGEMDSKINALESEIKKLSGGIRRTIHDFVRKDRAIVEQRSYR